MARLNRLYIPGAVQHVLLEALPEINVFPTQDSVQTFYSLLVNNAKEHDLLIHAFSLLPHQVQLLVTPSSSRSLPKTMQSIGRAYVSGYNRIYNRSGTLWRGRYRATVIDSAEWFLHCSVLIDTESYQYTGCGYSASSILHNGGHRTDPNLTTHAEYWALGNTPFERHAAYLKLVADGAGTPFHEAIMKHVRLGWALGSEEYKAKVTPQANRRIVKLSRGRPRKDGSPAGSVRALT